MLKNQNDMQNNDTMVTMQNAIVACVDLLGMGERVQELRMPDNAQDEAQVSKDLTKALGPVIEVDNFITSKMNCRFDHEQLLPIPDSDRTELEQAMPFMLNKHNMSDSWYLWVPVAHIPTNKVPEYGIMMFVIVLSELMLNSLAKNKPIRAGITLGPLILDPKIGPYGPALMQAHHLESKEAEYPRLLVDHCLVEQQKIIAVSNPSNKWDILRINLAKSLLSFFIQDDDGLYCIDYLHIFSAMPDLKNEMQNSLIAFAKQEHARFIEKKDAKLALRYNRLLNFILKNIK